MTENAFRKILQKPNRWRDVWLYSVTMAYLGFGIWTSTIFWQLKAGGASGGAFILIVSIVFYVMVIIALWAIQNQYGITTIISPLSVAEKQKVMQQYCDTLSEVIPKKSGDNIIQVMHVWVSKTQGLKYGTAVLLTVYTDEAKVMINTRVVPIFGLVVSGIAKTTRLHAANFFETKLQVK